MIVYGQQQGGVWRVVPYASRSLTDMERRYSQTEKEALALVWVCERFSMNVSSESFELETDHKPLERIYSCTSKPCARIDRWVLHLQGYDFKAGKDKRRRCLVETKLRETMRCWSGIRPCASNRRGLHTHRLVGKRD